jgi:hypothetical protein
MRIMAINEPKGYTLIAFGMIFGSLLRTGHGRRSIENMYSVLRRYESMNGVHGHWKARTFRGQ